jgi:hypothetical protein
MINVCFSSLSSMKRYVKNNKIMLLDNFGKLGQDYQIEIVTFSHDDIRAV